MKWFCAVAITLFGVGFITASELPHYCPGAEGSLGDGLVAYYPFEGNANDASGNGNHGVENGDPAYVGGVCGEAISLDGADDHVDMGLPTQLRITGALTASGWIMANPEQGPHPTIVSRYGRDVHNNRCWRLSLDDGKPHTCVSENGNSEVCLHGSTAVSTNVWHHIAMVYEPSQSLRLYLDGFLAAQNTSSVPGALNDPEAVCVYVGAFWWYGEAPGAVFNGNIDEVRIYDRALPACEIRNLACAPEPPCTPNFQGVGDLDGGIFKSLATGVSADGSVVIGQSSSASGTEAFRWTVCGDIEGLGDLAGGPFLSVANGASANGCVVVGYSDSDVGPEYEAFHWTQGSAMHGLGDLPEGSFYSEGRAVSADGSVVVGFGHSADGMEAFIWKDLNGNGQVDVGEEMQGLGDLPGGDHYSWATGVSSDGTVVAGRAYSASGHEAFIWKDLDADGQVDTGEHMQPLGDLAGGEFYSVAHDISADGLVVVGSSQSHSGLEAFRWTAVEGMVGLGDLPGGTFYSLAYGTSSDGSVIVGWGNSSGERAFIWDQYHGMRDLKDALESYGVDLSGWTLSRAYGISDDAVTIVGYGINPQGNTEGWIATICDTAPVNHAPVADAAGPYIAQATSWDGAFIQLDGTPSSDPDGDTLTYQWDLDLLVDSGNDGNPRNDVDATGDIVTQLFPVGQTEIALVVVDQGGLSSDPDITTVTVSVIQAEIDIKPGSYPNSINMGSCGVVPVAFLTSPDFDAATIEPATVTLRGEDFADGLVKVRGKKDAPVPMSDVVDVDGDGDLDLVVHLDTEKLAEYEIEAICELGALTYDGYVVSGSDTIQIVPE
jgi:probable HAF family extracellular repeat protein